MQRPHPLYLYYDIKKWLLLLLLPILRAIFANHDTISVILSSIRDVALATALIAYSAVKWRKSGYSLNNGLILKQGLIYQRRIRVLAKDAASIEIERNPLMWLAGGRRVRINTAGLKRRADATVYMPAKAAKIFSQHKTSGHIRRVYSRIIPVVILSASSSNAALGLLTLAPALKQAGQILGREVSGEVYGLINRIISLGLPPLFNTIANILVLGWCFAFLRTFTRTAGFTAEREGSRIHLVSGLLTTRNIYIDGTRITSLELRQTLFMRLFGLHTVTITAAGYGREKGARPVIVPAAHPKELCQALDALLPEYPTCPATVHPPLKALAGYALPPLLFTLGSFITLYTGGIWNMFAAVWFILGIWWMIVRLTGYQRAGFGVNEEAVTMRYSIGLALYEIHLPRESADSIRITQMPWQKKGGTCTVELRSFGEKRRRHRVRALPYSEAKRLVELLADTSQ